MLILQVIRLILLARHPKGSGDASRLSRNSTSPTGEKTRSRLQSEASPRPTGLIVADLMSDISFFIGFLVYPGVSTTIFRFFMSETFGGPGEDGLVVMRFDRSIEMQSELYKAFIPYAVIMMLLYPFG
jgi:hypothetical protein|eukprot:7186477-Prymnesium_polylepis.5